MPLAENVVVPYTNVPVIVPIVPVVLTVALGTLPSSRFLSSTVTVLLLTVVVIPLTVKFPDTVRSTILVVPATLRFAPI